MHILITVVLIIVLFPFAVFVVTFLTIFGLEAAIWVTDKIGSLFK